MADEIKLMAIRKQIREYYLYALFDEDRCIRYIGAGSGRRDRAHFRKGKKTSLAVAQIIAEMGRNPFRSVRLFVGLSRRESFEFERAFIAAIGRQDLGLGPLLNRTDGGPGAPGYIMTPHQRAKSAAARSGKIRSPQQRAAIEAGKAATKARRVAEVHAALEATGSTRKVLYRHRLPQWAKERLGPESPFNQYPILY